MWFSGYYSIYLFLNIFHLEERLFLKHLNKKHAPTTYKHFTFLIKTVWVELLNVQWKWTSVLLQY